MDNNHTDINITNNRLSPKESLSSHRQQSHWYQQNKLDINKTNNHLSLIESLSSEGQQLH